MQVWYPLDSSLPAAVRMSFLLFASFAAAGGKARKQLFGRALLAAAKLANNCLGERCWWRGDLNRCTKSFANKDVVIAL